MLKAGKLSFQLQHPLHRIVPAPLKGGGDQPVGGIDGFVAPLGEIGLIARPLDPQAPLCAGGPVALLKARQRLERKLDGHRSNRCEEAPGNGGIERCGRQRHAGMLLQRFAMLPVAMVRGIKAAVACIAHAAAGGRICRTRAYPGAGKGPRERVRQAPRHWSDSRQALTVGE